MRCVQIGWATALALACGPEIASAQSLRDLVIAGLATDPALAASEAQFKASEERARQARAALLPTLQATASRQEGRFSPDEPAAEVREFESGRWAVQLTQALYRPESYAAWSAAEADLEVARAQMEAAAAEVAAHLVASYFDMLSAREALVSLIREKDAAHLQLLAARSGFEKGTAAITEVLDAEARFDLTSAQRDAAENDIALKREAFQQLIGGASFELGLLPRAAPDPEPVTELLPLLIEEALERNAAAQQARLQWESSKLGVKRARRGHLPTLDLVLSYGEDDATRSPANPQPVEGRTSQAQATFTLPIFAGFGTSAKVGEALALQDKLQAELEAAERSVATAVREAYYGVKSSLGQIASLRTAEKSTETAVRAWRKGFQLGASTTAEVLEAEARYAQTRRDLMKAKFEARLSRIKLQVALGRPWRESIDEVANLLVPESQAPAEDYGAGEPPG